MYTRGRPTRSPSLAGSAARLRIVFDRSLHTLAAHVSHVRIDTSLMMQLNNHRGPPGQRTRPIGSTSVARHMHVAHLRAIDVHASRAGVAKKAHVQKGIMSIEL